MARYIGIVNWESFDIEDNVTFSLIDSPWAIKRLPPMSGAGDTSMNKLGNEGDDVEGVSSGFTGDGTGIMGLVVGIRTGAVDGVDVGFGKGETSTPSCEGKSL